MTGFIEDNTKSITQLLKKNTEIKSNKSNDNKAHFAIERIKNLSLKKKKVELTAEERLKKVKEEKARSKDSDEFGSTKRMIFYTIFKITYFVGISGVFALGVIKFGGAFIEAFQKVLFEAFSGILKK